MAKGTGMLSKLIAYFNNELQTETDENKGQKLQEACAVLLIEVSKADYDESSVERDTIRSLLTSGFNLSEQKINELLQLAQNESDGATSMYPFVKLINENYEYQQRVELVSKMWQVAYADNELSEYEDFIIRKIADLLHVSHSDFIRTKLEQAGS